jgi:hypothetical protein
MYLMVVRTCVHGRALPYAIAAKGWSMMDLVTKLPGMAEDALTTLGANAERLLQTGTPKQKTAATALLPAIQAEIASRRAMKLTEASAARSRRKK